MKHGQVYSEQSSSTSRQYCFSYISVLQFKRPESPPSISLGICQITSKPYTSKLAICIKSEDFTKGKLPVISYVRPDKLFTADKTIIKDVVGQLTPTIRNKILKNVRELFT